MKLFAVEVAVRVTNYGVRFAIGLRVSVARKSRGPGDVAMAGGVEGIPAFAENPPGARMFLAQGKVIGSDVLVTSRNALLRSGELVHESKTEIVLFGGEVHFCEATAELSGGFPTDLFAQAGFISCSFDRFHIFHEIEQDGFEKMPIFRAAGEQGTKRKDVALSFIDVDDSEVALAGGGYVEAEAEGEEWSEDFENDDEDDAEGENRWGKEE